MALCRQRRLLLKWPYTCVEGCNNIRHPAATLCVTVQSDLVGHHVSAEDCVRHFREEAGSTNI